MDKSEPVDHLKTGDEPNGTIIKERGCGCLACQELLCCSAPKIIHVTTCPPTCRPPYQPYCPQPCPPTCQPPCRPHCPQPCPPTCQPTCKPHCPPTCPPTCQPHCPSTCPPECQSAYPAPCHQCHDAMVQGCNIPAHCKYQNVCPPKDIGCC
ncbi:hypothetical protein ACOME3_007524 [Neoechinorhynchus agilis]